MTITLSSKGQIVIPAAARAKLGLVPGARLKCELGPGRLVLTAPARRGKTRMKISKLTGLPVFYAPPGVPPLTSERVRELMADFP